MENCWVTIWYKDLPIDSQMKTVYTSINLLLRLILTCCNYFTFQKIQLLKTWENTTQKFSTYLIWPITTSTQLLNERENLLDVWIDLCDVKMKSRYYLKFSKRHPNYMQLQQVTELNNRKNLEKTPCISSQRTILEQEYQNEKNVLKNHRF